MTPTPPTLTDYVAFWTSLTPASLTDLSRYYTADAYFRDPFNEVTGLAPITVIFEAMFERLEAPRFEILETISEGQSTFLIWDFTFRIQAFRPQLTRLIHGTTHVRFAPCGRVRYHRDYWDAASELYVHFPLIGGVLRYLRKRFA